MRKSGKVAALNNNYYSINLSRNFVIHYNKDYDFSMHIIREVMVGMAAAAAPMIY